jgi:hypothetical protein
LRDEYQKEAVQVALESNDRRLHAMNEFRASLADQAARLITRDESEAARAILADKVDGKAKAMNVRLEAELRPVHTRLNEVGRPNWASLASLISISFVLIAGIWLVIGLKIDSSLLAASVAVENIKVADATVAETVRNSAVASSASTQADMLSRDDRSQINGRMQVVKGLVASGNADRRAADARTAAQLIEIETQFKSASVVINIEKDETQRLLAVLWEKVFPGATLPPADYRPNLYRDN